MVGYTFVYGEAVEVTGSAERRPLLEDLQGMESQLDQIEKRIAELRALARQQADESSP
jgi:TolA-binding protein